MFETTKLQVPGFQALSIKCHVESCKDGGKYENEALLCPVGPLELYALNPTRVRTTKFENFLNRLQVFNEARSSPFQDSEDWENRNWSLHLLKVDTCRSLLNSKQRIHIYQ